MNSSCSRRRAPKPVFTKSLTFVTLAFLPVLYIMDNMQRSENTLKDSTLDVKDTSISVGYTKTNKLITALYMVTDIMDINEPIRLKLRTLGVGILSDMHIPLARSDLASGINQIVSFLEMASTLGMISEMNCGILKKEFIELKDSVLQPKKEFYPIGRDFSIAEFLANPDQIEEENKTSLPIKDNKYFSIGPRHSRVTGGPSNFTRIGVQKGSTLMKALSDKASTLHSKKENFDLLKKERRYEIVNIIKSKNQNGTATGATITDIKTGAKDTLSNFSEKTLQRELIAMIKDNVLYKTGTKRWSKYFIKNTL